MSLVKKLLENQCERLCTDMRGILEGVSDTFQNRMEEAIRDRFDLLHEDIERDAYVIACEIHVAELEHVDANNYFDSLKDSVTEKMPTT